MPQQYEQCLVMPVVFRMKLGDMCSQNQRGAEQIVDQIDNPNACFLVIDICVCFASSRHRWPRGSRYRPVVIFLGVQIIAVFCLAEPSCSRARGRHASGDAGDDPVNDEVRFLIEREGMTAREASRASNVPLWIAEGVEHDLAQQRTQQDAQYDAHAEHLLAHEYEACVQDEHDDGLDRIDKMITEVSR